MIVTITPNPSIDVSYFVDEFSLGQAHRISKMNKGPGGKGINVSKVLNQLGEKTLNLGFIAGDNGNYIKSSLKKLAIGEAFLEEDGETRTCIAINSNGQSTEIRELGPIISKNKSEEFFANLKTLARSHDYFTCSGSLPQGLNQDFFDNLLEILKDKTFIIDTSGQMIKHIVFESKIKPTLIKPNIDEVYDLFGEDAKNKTYLEILKSKEFKDIPMVVISLGKDGCVAKLNDKFYKCEIPKVKVLNTVGSGDSSVSGLIYGLKNKLSNEETLKYSMACGVLNAMEGEIAKIDPDKLDAMINKIKVVEIKE